MVATAGRLQDRHYLIVGGTGGIGLACARRFLHEGASVVLAGLETVAASSLSLGSDVLERVEVPTLDATRPEDVARLFAEAFVRRGRRLDGLVHVAGISGRRFGDGVLHECTDEGWEVVMAANARSVFLSNREAVRLMMSQEPDPVGLRGSIVNIGSVLAESPAPEFFGTIAYASSKGAMRSMTLASAARYANLGIRFNLVEPGLIDTPMAQRAVMNPAIRSYLETKQPLGAGPGSAGDVAEATLYLIEPASHFVTGTILPVDGGWCLSDGQIARSRDDE